MSTLAVVEEILRETAVPMTVREIVERAGARLPSKSKTPDTVVARDLAMDIKRKGEASLFTRTSPGRYTLRALADGVTAPSMAPTLAPIAVPGAVTAPASTSSPSSTSAPPSPPPAVTPASGALDRGRAPLLPAKRERSTDAASQAG